VGVLQKNVSLKGTKDGYQLIIQSSASFIEVKSETEELINQLKKETKAGQEIELVLKTGNRVFDEEEQEVLRKIIEEHSSFSVRAFEAEVVGVERALQWHKEASPTLEVTTVRSGQIVNAEGDLLLVGGVHPGGTVRATGSIFIIGELKGIAHAGFDGKESAVVVADFKYNAQVRVADHVHVIDRDEETLESSTSTVEVVYLNDLHILDVAPLDEVKRIRPELGKVTGGLF
jgi:septum site-determining protein MinC